MESNEGIIDRNEMRKYILDKFIKEGDFQFLEEQLPAMVDEMLDLDSAYAESVGDDVYDDDAAYEAMFAAMQERHPDQKTYCMRLVEDYMDFAEEYLVSIDAIEWE